MLAASLSASQPVCLPVCLSVAAAKCIWPAKQRNESKIKPLLLMCTTWQDYKDTPG